MKKYILLLLCIIAFSCTNMETKQTPRPTVIGYENDNGSKYDIVSGSISSTEIVKAYFDAYNNKDLQAVYELEHEDVELYAHNGLMVESSKQHLELGKQFFESNQIASWKITWSMSADVNFEDKPKENWVTSGIIVTFGKEEESKTSVSRVVDLMIVEGKIKKGYIYQRELSESELSTL